MWKWSSAFIGTFYTTVLFNISMQGKMGLLTSIYKWQWILWLLHDCLLEEILFWFICEVRDSFRMFKCDFIFLRCSFHFLKRFWCLGLSCCCLFLWAWVCFFFFVLGVYLFVCFFKTNSWLLYSNYIYFINRCWLAGTPLSCWNNLSYANERCLTFPCNFVF